MCVCGWGGGGGLPQWTVDWSGYQSSPLQVQFDGYVSYMCSLLPCLLQWAPLWADCQLCPPPFAIGIELLQIQSLINT